MRGSRLLIAFAICGTGAAATVDRVAVAVGNRVITESSIEERIRLTAFQNRAEPDFGVASRKQAAEMLIDQKLVEKEMEVGRFPRTGAARSQEELAAFEKTEYGGDHAALLEALQKYQLTDAGLMEELGRQADLLTFLDLRFRPAIQVSEQDLQKYFEEVVPSGPGKEQLGFGGLRAAIEEKLTQERADNEMEMWLKDQRKRTKIDYVEADLK
jgi:hypothetical protein